MTWWAWTLLWVVLVLGAGGVFFLVGRSLWRKGMALARELGDATERLTAVADELGTLQEGAREQEEPAIFADPTRLRQERITARRRRRSGRPRRPRALDEASGT